MKVESFSIKGPLLIEPRIFKDHRGYFLESFNETRYSEIIDSHFVQDNLSKSKKNVLRGLHFQTPPHAQGKLVSVIQGAVLDVFVDIRRSSPTYGKHLTVKLTGTNHKQLWIPPGFAHGFVALQENTVFSYKCTDVYSPECERTILWNDASLNIDWNVDDPIISEKDMIGIAFTNFETPFL